MEAISMDKILEAPLTPTESAELEAALVEIMAEIDRVRERMKGIQARTERLGAETRTMLAQMKPA